MLLTGDHEAAARHIAGALGIGSYRAQCLPEDKLAWIERSQQEGRQVCMVGDGINDAPALKKALWASPWGAWAATSPWTPPTSPW